MAPKLTEQDQHALGLGQIVGNLHSLEYLLRVFLYRHEVAKDPSRAGPSDIFNLKVGDNIVENALTNYDALSTVITRYNKAVATVDPTLQIDPTVSDLRDVIAHGRVLAEKPARPLRLFKFSQTNHGQVSVTHALVLTDEWVTNERGRLYAEIQKAQSALGKIK